MLDEAALEIRLATLEQAVADLQSRLNGTPASANWLDNVSGSMSDEAAFLEALEYGRAFRQAVRDFVLTGPEYPLSCNKVGAPLISGAAHRPGLSDGGGGVDSNWQELSIEERLTLAQQLWDSVAADLEREPLTAAQRAELERRVAAADAHPEEGVPWEVIRAEARARWQR